ncbi:MAG: hypothetical protein ACRDL6_12480 [Solirubrobacterales bacterium]
MARETNGPDPRLERSEAEPQTFTMPLLAALYGSVVVIAVIFVLRTEIGRDIEDKLDAPARTLIAAPLVVLAVIVFCAGLVALIVPAYRREVMRVAEFAAWIIPAWALMAGLVLGAIAWALARLD